MKLSRNFIKIRDKIFYMQGHAGWATEDYEHASDSSEIRLKWSNRASSLINTLGSEEKALEILDIIIKPL